MRLDIERELQSRRPLLLLAAVALVALMLRSSFTSGFYTFDDTMYIYRADCTPVLDVFSPQAGSVPITLLSFKLDRALFGPRATTPRPLVCNLETLPPPEVEKSYREGIFAPAARILNGLYHLLAGIFLWLFLWRIRTHAGVALVVAFAWLGHPTACESVCWISERKNVLVALFGFAALYAWSERQWRWRWPAVYALYALALGSKQSAVGLFPILVALEIIDPAHRSFNLRSTKDWTLLARHMLVPALLVFGELAMNMGGLRTAPRCPVLSVFLTDCEVFGRYALHTLFPVNLSFFYGIVPLYSPLDVQVWLYGIPLVLIFAISILASKPSDRPLVLFGIIWFFSALAPNANVAVAVYWMQDRYMYLSLPGILLAVSYGLIGIVTRFQNSDRILQFIAAGWMAFLIICLGIRAGYFIDTDTLEIDAVEREPQSALAQLTAGVVYRHLAFDSAPGGVRPDPNLLKLAARKCCLHFQNAINCPDRQFFVNPFETMLACVEVRMQAGEYEPAAMMLEEILPTNTKPVGSTVLVNGVASSYTIEMLAHGWALLGEILLRQSLSPALSASERESLLNKALAAVTHSSEVNSASFEGTIVRAKILLQISTNDTEKQDTPAAEEHFQLAVSLLRSVPAGSANEKVAKFLLDHAKAPK